MERSLNLDAESLDRSAEIHEGYARLIERDRSEDDRPDEMAMIRASSFVLAAIYRALVGDERALELFREAAYEYIELERPFYVVLAVCANDIQLIYDHVERLSQRDVQSDAPPTDPETLLFDLLATMSAVATQQSNSYAFQAMNRVLDRGDSSRLLPVGRLGLPLRLYLSIGRGVAETVSGEDRELATLREALAEYLRRMDEVIGGAMNDTFHWERLRTGVLPVEPEALAACITVDAVSRRIADRRVENLTVEAELTRRQRVPAQVATAISRW